MSLLVMLARVAAITFVVGWAVVILDAMVGFKLIERIPARISGAFGAIHNGAFIAIGVILLAGLIWDFANG